MTVDAGDLANLGWLNAAALVVAAGFHVARRPAAEEERIRVLEALTVAARRGMPLAPVLERAAQESGRRRRVAMERTAEELESGVPLSEALGGCGALRFPARTLESLRAAEGTEGFADALAGAARDEAEARARRQRPASDLGYVLLVALTVTPVAWIVARQLDALGSVADVGTRVPSPPEIGGAAWTVSWWVAAAWFTVTAVPLALVLLPVGLSCARRRDGRRLPRWSVIGEVPPFRTPGREAGLARFFDALAAHLRVGTPLALAARTASAAAWNRRVRNGAAHLADDVEHGEPAAVAWEHVPLRASVRGRAIAACAAPAETAAATFEGLAAECRARAALWVESRSRWIVPVGLLLLGCGCALLYAELMDVLNRTRAAAAAEFLR